MIRSTRRALLGMFAAAAAALLPPSTSAAPEPARREPWPPADPALPPVPAGADDPLLAAAADWVAALRADGQAILPYPVSRLQRRLRTGYLRSLRLAEALAAQGEWSIDYDAAGKRYARIHPKGRA